MRENPGVSVQVPEVLDVEPDDREPSRRPVVAGAAAGLWSLAVGVALVSCLVMLAWAASPNSAGDPAAAWRAAGYAWLGAHQVPLEIGGRGLTLLPLGALLLGLLLTRRGGRWAGRLLTAPSTGEAVAIVAACALVYGAGGAGVAWLSESPGTGADPVQAFLFTAVVAAVGVTWGIAKEGDLVARARARTSDAAWRTAMGAVAAVVGLVAVGGILVTVSLVRHFSEIATTMADLNAGPVGELALTVVGVLCLPTLDIWGLSVIVGPGFELGSGNGLSAFGGEVEILPALPVLAAVPAGVPAWAPVLLCVPVALGVLAARIRWGRDLPTLTGTIASGAGLAGGVALLVAGLCLLASGSLGGGRLAAVGPQPLAVAGAAAGLVLLGFLAEAAFQSLHLSWSLYRVQRRAETRAARRADAPDAQDPEAQDLDAEGPDAEGPDAEADLVRPVDPAEAGIRAAAGGEVVEGDAVDGDAARTVPAAAKQRAEPRAARVSIAIPVVIDVPDAAPAAELSAGTETSADAETCTAAVTSADAEQPIDLTGEVEPLLDDSTVDIELDDAVLAMIRAAAHPDADGNLSSPGADEGPGEEVGDLP